MTSTGPSLAHVTDPSLDTPDELRQHLAEWATLATTLHNTAADLVTLLEHGNGALGGFMLEASVTNVIRGMEQGASDIADAAERGAAAFDDHYEPLIATLRDEGIDSGWLTR